jgi:hypothetical protein
MTPRKRSSRAGASEGSTRTDEEAKDDEAVKELKEIIQAKDSGDLLALGSLENEEGDPDVSIDPSTRFRLTFFSSAKGSLSSSYARKL